MKSIRWSLWSAAVLLIAGNAMAADSLTWPQLAGRPEYWPREVSVTSAMNFQGGVHIAAGQKVDVEQIKPGEIDLVTADGKINFAARPEETDALAVANQAYSKLTPKQRALTYASIAQQKDLWPARLTLTQTFQIGGGQSLPAGESMAVQDVQPDRVLVLVERLNSTYNFSPQATDLMAQARTFVEDPQAGPRLLAEQKAAEGKKLAEAQQTAAVRVVKELDGILVNSVTGKPDPLDPAATPRYFVFLRGSSTCPFTHKYAPQVVQFYNQIKLAHPDVEAIWIMTESPEDTGKFARELGISWRAVEYEKTGAMPSVDQHIDRAGRLPQLIVVDRAGHMLASGIRDEVPAVLSHLDEILKHPAQ